MGRRKKSSQKKITKKKPTLAKTFKCPFCGNTTVECIMDRKSSTGKLKCRICGAGFSAPIHYLSEPIDVFCEWIDECEEANEEALEGGGAGADF